jgi:LmbE family N-acetylglucosaminyl deacetylase
MNTRLARAAFAISLGVAFNPKSLLLAETTPPKILIVVAHPDDEYAFAATVYHLARENGAIVDQLVVTDGAGGFRYSSPAEKYYGLPLADAASARRNLPRIRKQELAGSGKILGVREHFFLDQPDPGYTTDVNEALRGWKPNFIEGKIAGVLRAGRYDFVFTLEPFASAHGQHQAATYLALKAVADLPDGERPVVLGAFTDFRAGPVADADHAKEIADAKNFAALPGLPLTRVATDVPALCFDRRRRFGPGLKLNYQIFVDWMIAEHKSQGMFQTYPGRDDAECFRVFALSGRDGINKAAALFR